MMPQMPAYQMQPPPAPQAMPPKKPAIFWVLILGLSGLFLIAIVLVLFFALKH
jgi:flagellar basal body-associated protein FliL